MNMMIQKIYYIQQTFTGGRNLQIIGLSTIHKIGKDDLRTAHTNKLS